MKNEQVKKYFISISFIFLFGMYY